MIRQAISCDICASEKRQTNHWFVAYEQAGKLRVSGWSSRHKLRPGSKHLCGQTCLHKLVDEFMAKTIAVRAQRSVDEPAEEIAPHPPAVRDASLTSTPDYEELESSARIIAPPAPVLPKPVYRPQPELVTTPPRPHADYVPSVEEAQRYASRNWRAEAWERERERELRAIGKRPGIATRRASNA
ncbi:MAG: hypothetical protein WCF30_02315 [Terracidiphilus sp.]